MNFSNSKRISTKEELLKKRSGLNTSKNTFGHRVVDMWNGRIVNRNTLANFRTHISRWFDKNSSGDEIANVNFFYNIAHVEASAYAH